MLPSVHPPSNSLRELVGRSSLLDADLVEKTRELGELGNVGEPRKRLTHDRERRIDEAKKTRVCSLLFHEDEATGVLEFALYGDEIELVPKRARVVRRESASRSVVVQAPFDETRIERLVAVAE